MKKRVAKLLATAMTLSMLLTACSGNASQQSNAQVHTTSEQQTFTPPTSDSTSTQEITSAERPDLAGVEQVFNWNLVSEPPSLDPGLSSALNGSHVIMNLYEGLFRDRGRSNRRPEPAAAQSVDISQDGLVYIFTLRDGALWSDGVPVRAQDFEFSWKRTINPATASTTGYIFEPIKNFSIINSSVPNSDGTFSDENGNIVLNEDGNPITLDDLGIESLDDKTLKVTLERPTDYFLGTTDSSPMVPLREDIVGDDISGLWARDPEKVVSNGPFVLANYTIGDSFVLEKNENYWDSDEVVLEKINVRFITDASTALTSFRANEIHYSEQFPTEEMQALLRTGEVRVFDILGLQSYVLNTETEELKDVNVRLAISKIISREDIAAFRGAGNTPATGMVPYGIYSSTGEDFRDIAGDHGVSLTSDFEGALELLQEAGYTVVDGKVQDFPRLEIFINTGSNHEEVAQIIQNDFREVGIEIDIRIQEWQVFLNSRSNLEYNGIARHGWAGAYVDPQTFIEIFRTGNDSAGNGYSNPEFDAAIEKATVAMGSERFELWAEAERILMEDRYVIPLVYDGEPALVNPSVQGLYVQPTGHLWFGDTFLAE